VDHNDHPSKALKSDLILEWIVTAKSKLCPFSASRDMKTAKPDKGKDIEKAEVWPADESVRERRCNRTDEQKFRLIPAASVADDAPTR
jgi:hypothetical protein